MARLDPVEEPPKLGEGGSDRPVGERRKTADVSRSLALCEFRHRDCHSGLKSSGESLILLQTRRPAAETPYRFIPPEEAVGARQAAAIPEINMTGVETRAIGGFLEFVLIAPPICIRARRRCRVRDSSISVSPGFSKRRQPGGQAGLRQ
jgi:hypothetical protein